MTPFEFGAALRTEKSAAIPAGSILTHLVEAGKGLGKGIGGIDRASSKLLNALASGTRGVGRLFGAAGDAAAPIGRGVFNASTTLAENKIKNQPVSDVLKMLGYTGRVAGKGFEASGGGAGLVNKGLNWAGNRLDDIAGVGYGAPTATAIGLGGAGSAAGVLQNPIRIAPQKDHIDVRSPVTLPPSIRNLFDKKPPLRQPRYSATGKRRF